MHNFFKGKRSDEWQTPLWLFDELDYDFRWDLACTVRNAKAPRMFEGNSLEADWSKTDGTCWLNPPFSKATAFYEKAAKEKPQLVSIYKASNLETVLWQDVIIPHADWICFIKRRVNYVNDRGMKSTGVTFGSALIGYNVPCHTESLGRVWQIK